jgi:hypothetical protein
MMKIQIIWKIFTLSSNSLSWVHNHYYPPLNFLWSCLMCLMKNSTLLLVSEARLLFFMFMNASLSPQSPQSLINSENLRKFWFFSDVYEMIRCSSLCRVSSSDNDKLKIRNEDKEDEAGSTALLSTHCWTTLLTVRPRQRGGQESEKTRTGRRRRPKRTPSSEWLRRPEGETGRSQHSLWRSARYGGNAGSDLRRCSGLVPQRWAWASGPNRQRDSWVRRGYRRRQCESTGQRRR